MEVVDYNEDLQKLMLRYLVSDPDLWMRTRNIISINFFHKSLRPIVRLMKDYSDAHNGLPRPEQVEVLTGTKLEVLNDLNERDKDWFLQTIEKFCRQRALEEWIIKGPDYIKDSNFGELEQGLRDALLISLYKNLGTSYYESPKDRLQALRDQRGGLTTGWTDFDRILDGGMNFGELHIFAGQSGAGKSIWLQNLALNMSEQGLNVVYMTLELGEEMISQRIDAMNTGFSTGEVMRRMDDVDAIVKRLGQKNGMIMIKEIPAESTTNDIKAYLKELEIQMEVRPDVLIIDYLDLVAPNNKRIDVSNLFIKDKFVSQELRAMAREGLGPDHKLLCLTASQLNRQATDEEEHNQAHIAGGKSKIDAADGFYSIHTSLAMREKGMYKLQFLKTRNSTGAGRIIPFGYNMTSMRISDYQGDPQDAEEVDIFSQIAGNSSLANVDNTGTMIPPKANTSPPTPKPVNTSDILDKFRKIRGDDDI